MFWCIAHVIFMYSIFAINTPIFWYKITFINHIICEYYIKRKSDTQPWCHDIHVFPNVNILRPLWFGKWLLLSEYITKASIHFQCCKSLHNNLVRLAPTMSLFVRQLIYYSYKFSEIDSLWETRHSLLAHHNYLTHCILIV